MFFRPYSSLLSPVLVGVSPILEAFLVELGLHFKPRRKTSKKLQPSSYLLAVVASNLIAMASNLTLLRSVHSVPGQVAARGVSVEDGTVWQGMGGGRVW